MYYVVGKTQCYVNWRKTNKQTTTTTKKEKTKTNRSQTESRSKKLS